MFGNDIDARKGCAYAANSGSRASLFVSPHRIGLPPLLLALRVRRRLDRPYIAGDERLTSDRSAIMRSVKSRDTSPELAVRALLRPIAPGYRLHRGDLPGKPDLAYISRKLAVFVHGCFWHGHDCARGSRVPKTNAAYWRTKISHNRARDEKTIADYAAIGWRTLVIYECELKDKATLTARLASALGAERAE